MIKNWTIQNFKSVYSEVNLQFSPLTLFAGANSSGKSTLIQSILLTAQTLQSQVHSRKVVLNGHIVRLGEFKDVLANGAIQQKVKIGFDLLAPEPDDPNTNFRRGRYYYSSENIRKADSIHCSYTFSAEQIEEKKESLLPNENPQLQPYLDNAEISLVTTDKPNGYVFRYLKRKRAISETMREFHVSEESISPSGRLPLEYAVATENSVPSSVRYFRIPKNSRIAGVFLRHFLPEHLTVAFDHVADECEQIFESLARLDEDYRIFEPSEEVTKYVDGLPQFHELLISIFQEFHDENPSAFGPRNLELGQILADLRKNFSLELAGKFISNIVAQKRRLLSRRLLDKKGVLIETLIAGRAPVYQLTGAPLSEEIGFAGDYIRSYFVDNVRYLGPLRDEPKPVYPIAGNSEPNDVGFKGEHTAAVLDSNSDTFITYLPSASVPFHNDSPSICSVRLEDAVLDWVDYMGIGKKFSTEDKGKLGHELKISTTGSEQLHDLTHVGVGVSQVLPILVSSLLSPKGSTLIFEQPELHLHPKVQSRLADFFISLILAGKQCVVETHSEYIVSRLRYLSLVSEGKRISDSIKMYFVDKKESGSEYRLVKINENGIITDWPEGFFDENERNAAEIINAALLRNKLKKGS